MTLAAHTRTRPGAATLDRAHWRMYLIEGTLLGLFMISACTFGILIEHPDCVVRNTVHSPLLRRMLMGIAMGATATALIYTRWGRRSGAHMNPATTLAFLRLGRIRPVDAAGYVAAHFAGGAVGVAVMAGLFGTQVMHPSVNYVATLPGMHGLLAAWTAEFVIALVMLTMVLNVNRIPKLAPYTGCFAGLLVAIYIMFEAPISGMSLNPARTFASAVIAGQFSFLWIYLTAPIAGMLAGVEVNRLLARAPEQLCGKFSHSRTVACIFKCDCINRHRDRA